MRVSQGLKGESEFINIHISRNINISTVGKNYLYAADSNHRGMNILDVQSGGCKDRILSDIFGQID
jgi:hypothetical protein